jgi:hypothetical protein
LLYSSAFTSHALNIVHMSQDNGITNCKLSRQINRNFIII